MSLKFLTGSLVERGLSGVRGVLWDSDNDEIPAFAGMGLLDWVPRSSRGMTANLPSFRRKPESSLTKRVRSTHNIHWMTVSLLSFRRKPIRRTAESSLTKRARSAHNTRGMAGATIPVVLHNSRLRGGQAQRNDGVLR
jgi:hypothetical protein